MNSIARRYSIHYQLWYSRTMLRYFLYARKSTDVEDKQILSIEGQLAELREIAKREQLNVVEVFVEKKVREDAGSSNVRRDDGANTKGRSARHCVLED